VSQLAHASIASLVIENISLSHHFAPPAITIGVVAHLIALLKESLSHV